MGRWRRLGSGLARGLAFALVAILVLMVAALLVIQTPWAHDRLRAIVVSQANRYLTATLEIGHLGGSLFRGIELDNVSLSRGGTTLVAIDHLEVGYSIRDLIGAGTSIQRLALTRPRVSASRDADGRWDLASLVKRDTRSSRTSGPGRPIRIDRVEIVDGTVTLGNELTFGAAHVPTTFTDLTTTLSFAYQPVTWTVDFEDASFVGRAPDLTVRSLTGSVGSGDAGWMFDHLHVVTPRSDFTVDGRVNRQSPPTTLDLRVQAERLPFQEWAGVVHGLSNLAVDSSFSATLAGPLTAMQTTIELRSNGGDVRADVVLDSSVPGWHAKGGASVQRLDLGRWLNRPDRPSDISGDVTLDVDLQLGGHFPRGPFTFRGAHAGYLEYEADDVEARGTMTATEVHIAAATATAYGANVRLANSTLAIDAPFGFHFIGTASGVDLRQVPRSVPVPHVESTLAFDYDVTGQFAEPFIRGSAAFADSLFLGARLDAGAAGSIDTQAVPFHYAGSGAISEVDLNAFGSQLQIGWMTDPRYAGRVRGVFHVDGTGSELATMALTGGGRLDEADLFRGQMSDGDVSVSVANGSMEASFDGALTRVDPSVAMADPLYAARLTGRARGHIIVRDLLVRAPELGDYTMEASLDARDSLVRGVEITRGTVDATLANGTMQIARLTTAGPGVDLDAHGRLELDGVRSSALDYHVTRSDLSSLRALVGRDMAGQAVSTGVMSGPLGRPRFQGSGTVNRLAVAGLSALTAVVSYDATVHSDDPFGSVGTLKARLSFVNGYGQELQSMDGDVTYDAGHTTATLSAASVRGLNATLTGTVDVDVAGRTLDLGALTLQVQRTAWRLAGGAAPRIQWTDTGFAVSTLDLVDAGTGRQHLVTAGTWDRNGSGTLRVDARGVVLDTWTTEEGRPVRYGGIVDGTALVRGTADDPRVSADFAVTQGRVRRLAYERFAGHADYAKQALQVDVRLDQAPGVWLTAAGAVPTALFDQTKDAAPMNLTVKSSRVGLALLEGVTDLVRNVGGEMQLDVTVVGTSRDPHFTGRAELTNASFDVVSSGARYRNGRMALQLASDRVAVETLHVEDESGHPLDVTGSLGTHEMRVGDLQVAVTARGFQVLRNEFGRVDIDANLNLAGEFESPKLTGRITVSGGSVNVDRILDRALFQPYSTQEATLADIDPIVALNPWQRMGIDIELHVPGTLRMVGDNVQVSPGTPLGLGNIDLRAFGDLYLYKDPAQPMYVNGSFDSLTGTYAFQGRRFDLDPSSSINFRGDLNPELYVTVNRVISGVETRVSILGPLQQPELRLASTPPLDQSDILSLIVFNTSMNELSALQQQQLAVRAGTLAAGFIAAPMMAALERTIGIDTLEIEPGTDVRGGPRVTVGNELAPGLVARFSRQFGESDYDEATIEYYLSRILRIRATFSDASSLSVISPFRRVERAGIDLLLFFSF
jgi:autotransporter translocation and assembly factor TamB